jgi:hypothetical protein
MGKWDGAAVGLVLEQQDQDPCLSTRALRSCPGASPGAKQTWLAAPTPFCGSRSHMLKVGRIGTGY